MNGVGEARNGCEGYGRAEGEPLRRAKVGVNNWPALGHCGRGKSGRECAGRPEIVGIPAQGIPRPQQCDCAILPDLKDTGTSVNRSTVVSRAHVMQSGKATGVGLSAATTEAHVISGNIQDGPESRMLRITRDGHAHVVP